MTLEARLAFLDVETTGADPRDDRITEVGLALVDDGRLVEEWSSLINPGREIPPGIETLTGITDEMVAQAPGFSEISLDLAERLRGRLLIAHNARFDNAFLRQEFRRAGMPFEARVLCTVRLSRALFPGERYHNLDALIERFGLSCPGRHRAMPDARVLIDLTRAMAAHVPPDVFTAAVGEVVRTPLLPEGLDAAVIENLPEAPGVYVLHDPAGMPLFAGKAMNLRAQVLAHFAERGPKAQERRAALQAGALEWTPAAGPLGAALRQRRLVEALAPRHNRAPRAHNEAWALHWHPGADAARLVDLQAEASALADLFGPFRSRDDAAAALRGLSREFVLCARVLGLESGCGPCSKYAAGLCRGVCAGVESRIAHAMRLAQALARLRLPPWPFPGTVAIVEEDRSHMRSELHVARDWRYLGSARTPAEACELLPGSGARLPFDVDIFRILRRALDEPDRYAIERLD